MGGLLAKLLKII